MKLIKELAKSISKYSCYSNSDIEKLIERYQSIDLVMNACSYAPKLGISLEKGCEELFHILKAYKWENLNIKK